MQTTNYELILVDNTSNKFESAAQGLNYGSKKANGKYLMFVHQDILLCSVEWLKDAEKIMEPFNNIVAGIVGMSEHGVNNKTRGRNVLIHGDPPEEWGWGNKIQKPETVQTLDECLVIIPKTIFDRYNFDESIFNRWDLYVVDYCLRLRTQGIESYVLPLSVYHHSTGVISLNYFHAIKNILKKNKHLKHVYTTCGDWNPKYPLFLQKTTFILILQMFLNKINARKLRIYLKGKFK